MNLNIYLSAALAAAVMFGSINTGSSQDRSTRFSVSVSGGLFPTITGSTNLPDGTELLVNVKKPWLPDGAQRIARGLPACGDDCFPATVGQSNLIGATVVVRGGSFSAGPFSFNGQPFRPGTYPLEISFSIDPKTATSDQLSAIGTVLYGSMIEVPSGTPQDTPVQNTPRSQTASPQNKIYQPHYSEKIEADNGAAYAVDLSTARHFGALVQAGVYDLNQGIIIASPMWFQCGYAKIGTDPRLMSYVPPHSVGARLLAIACAEADRHPER